MANNQVDRYGNPILPAGLQQFIAADGTLIRQRPLVRLVSGATASDNDSQNSTDLNIAGAAQNAAATTFLAATTAVAEAALLGTTIPTQGTNIPNADTTVAIDGGSQYFMPSATAARIVTLGTAGSPLTGEVIVLHITRTNAFAVTIKDDAATTLIIVPASVPMTVTASFDGTHYTNARAIRIQA